MQRKNEIKKAKLEIVAKMALLETLWNRYSKNRSFMIHPKIIPPPNFKERKRKMKKKRLKLTKFLLDNHLKSLKKIEIQKKEENLKENFINQKTKIENEERFKMKFESIGYVHTQHKDIICIKIWKKEIPKIKTLVYLKDGRKIGQINDILGPIHSPFAIINHHLPISLHQEVFVLNSFEKYSSLEIKEMHITKPIIFNDREKSIRRRRIK